MKTCRSEAKLTRRRLWSWLLVTLLVGAASAPPALAQSTAPMTFEDAAPTSVTWPDPVTATVLNNTTENLIVTVQITDFEDPATGATLPASSLMLPFQPSITVPPAGEAELTLPVEAGAQPVPGTYTASLVLSSVSHNAVLRKPVTLIVPLPAANLEQRGPVPTVETWTLNAVRLLPFLHPICLRGLAFGCTIPVTGTDAAPETATPVGLLSNERGGGLVVTLREVDEGTARLGIRFDRRWGLSGAYTGRVVFGEGLAEQQGAAAAESAANPNAVAMTVNVKDFILWPLLILWLGISLARLVQRYLTIHRDVLRLLRRLNEVEDTFDHLRKSIYGYSIADDFKTRTTALNHALEAWDRSHYGEPTASEKAQFREVVIRPLEELEQQIAIWARFQEKLQRLRRAMEQQAKPAVQQAVCPEDLDLDEPVWYTHARQLLDGIKLTVPQISEYAERIDHAAELASSWGEMNRLAVLVQDALYQLRDTEVDLSESEHEMLETARHLLNSAVRDLWEARDLEELRERRTQSELAEARELTQRLIDPYVYYAGSELATGAELSRAEGEEAPVPGFPVMGGGMLRNLVRTYAHLDGYPAPRLDYETYKNLETGAERAAYVEQALLMGERTVTWVALLGAMIAGLDRYFNSNFGSLADYLALLTYALATKAGLEILNVVISRLVSFRAD